MAPPPSALSAKRPSAPVRACANCLGASALAAHKVTVEPAIGAPAPTTWPSIALAANTGAVESRPTTTACSPYLRNISEPLPKVHRPARNQSQILQKDPLYCFPSLGE